MSNGNEKIQSAMNNLALFLKTTRGLGSEDNNPLDRIEVVEYENGERFARPVFRDGTGAKAIFTKGNSLLMHGYYDVNITADSPDAAVYDVWEHFVKQFI